MIDYKSMYFSLFNSITDAIEILKKAQKKGEQAYMDGENEQPVVMDDAHNNTDADM